MKKFKKEGLGAESAVAPCKHSDPQLLSGWEWCPDCGASRLRAWSKAWKQEGWKLPRTSRKGEFYLLLAEFLRGMEDLAQDFEEGKAIPICSCCEEAARVIRNRLKEWDV